MTWASTVVWQFTWPRESRRSIFNLLPLCRESADIHKKISIPIIQYTADVMNLFFNLFESVLNRLEGQCWAIFQHFFTRPLNFISFINTIFSIAKQAKVFAQTVRWLGVTCLLVGGGFMSAEQRHNHRSQFRIRRLVPAHTSDTATHVYHGQLS